MDDAVPPTGRLAQIEALYAAADNMDCPGRRIIVQFDTGLSQRGAELLDNLTAFLENAGTRRAAESLLSATVARLAIIASDPEPDNTH